MKRPPCAPADRVFALLLSAAVSTGNLSPAAAQTVSAAAASPVLSVPVHGGVRLGFAPPSGSPAAPMAGSLGGTLSTLPSIPLPRTPIADSRVAAPAAGAGPSATAAEVARPRWSEPAAAASMAQGAGAPTVGGLKAAPAGGPVVRPIPRGPSRPAPAQARRPLLAGGTAVARVEAAVSLPRVSGASRSAGAASSLGRFFDGRPEAPSRTVSGPEARPVAALSGAKREGPLRLAAPEDVERGRGAADVPAPPSSSEVSEPAAPPHERRLAALGFAWHFMTIAAMYIVMPVRSAFLLTLLGPSVLPWAMMGSAVLTGLAAWLYARFTHLPRGKFIGGTLAVLSGTLAGWWLLAPLAMRSGAVSFAFSLWTDTFSIMAVTLFWTYANDRFRGDAAKRWFGTFIAAGALGGMAGSAATKYLVGIVGAAPMLLAAAAIFAGILAVFTLMERIGSADGPSASDAPTAAGGRLSNPWAVAKAVAASPFLLALTGLVFFERFVPDLSYYIFNVMAQGAYAGKEALAAFMAGFGFWQNVASLLSGLFLTKWLLGKLGVGRTLLGAPLANLAGFIAFALFPTFGVAVTYNGVEGWQRYSSFKAAKETVYTTADKGVIYGVKAYVEMFVYRFARGAAGLILLLLTGKAFLGLSPWALAWLSVPFALAWTVLAWRLGKEHARNQGSGSN